MDDRRLDRPRSLNRREDRFRSEDGNVGHSPVRAKPPANKVGKKRRLYSARDTAQCLDLLRDTFENDKIFR